MSRRSVQISFTVGNEFRTHIRTSKVCGGSALNAETINRETFTSGWTFNSQKLQGKQTRQNIYLASKFHVTSRPRTLRTL